MTSKTDLESRAEDFKRVFLGDEAGVRVLAHIYKLCNMNTQIHDPASPHNTSFNAGKHRVGQAIQSILGQDETSITQILKQTANAGILNLAEDYDPFNTTQ